MVTKLIGRTGPVAGRDFVMADDVTVARIGGDSNNEICIRADGVSREHARVRRRADGCWIEDAGSRNGTFVNGLRVGKAERLRHLDVVTLARRVDLIFIQSDAALVEHSPQIHAAALEFLNGPSAGGTVDLPVGELTIGRAATCNIVVSHPSIGKVHARIVRTAGQVTIEDLQSANGTFVNDRRIAVEVLNHDDHISLGSVAQLRAQIRADFGAGLPLKPAAESNAAPAVGQDWNTRVVWSPTELAEINKHRARVLDMMDQSSEEPSASAPSGAGSAVTPPAADVRAVQVIGGEDGPVRLGPGIHTIGRGATADVRLPESELEASRLHAILTVSADGAVSIEGRGTNETFVNDQEMKGRGVLREGDRVRCGRTTLTVHLL
jgi:pSer/pThr/pTyr-binding forkhead associated (FHA) protein